MISQTLAKQYHLSYTPKKRETLATPRLCLPLEEEGPCPAPHQGLSTKQVSSEQALKVSSLLMADTRACPAPTEETVCQAPYNSSLSSFQEKLDHISEETTNPAFGAGVALGKALEGLKAQQQKLTNFCNNLLSDHSVSVTAHKLYHGLFGKLAQNLRHAAGFVYKGQAIQECQDLAQGLGSQIEALETGNVPTLKMGK